MTILFVEFKFKSNFEPDIEIIRHYPFQVHDDLLDRNRMEALPSNMDTCVKFSIWNASNLGKLLCQEM